MKIHSADMWQLQDTSLTLCRLFKQLVVCETTWDLQLDESTFRFLLTYQCFVSRRMRTDWQGLLMRRLYLNKVMVNNSGPPWPLQAFAIGSWILPSHPLALVHCRNCLPPSESHAGIVVHVYHVFQMINFHQLRMRQWSKSPRNRKTNKQRNVCCNAWPLFVLHAKRLIVVDFRLWRELAHSIYQRTFPVVFPRIIVSNVAWVLTPERTASTNHTWITWRVVSAGFSRVSWDGKNMIKRIVPSRDDCDALSPTITFPRGWLFHSKTTLRALTHHLPHSANSWQPWKLHTWPRPLRWEGRGLCI